jgi:lipoprotein-anchoring transpeptidase ErfK/SrfK
MLRIWAFVFSFVALCASGALALDADAVNRAEWGAKPARGGKDLDPAMVKAQVLLDRARFSPGEIDGRPGENAQKAIAAFRAAQGLPPGRSLDADAWAKLAATSNEPVLTEYTLTDEDVKGPFVKKIPAKMEDMKDLDSLGYRTPLEALAEKFHMSEGLVKALNGGKSFDRAGETIVVANVGREAPNAKAAKIEIDKSQKTLKAFGKDGQLLAVYPGSIGSKDKPAPDGTLKVTSVAQNPTYKYDPAYQFKGVKAKEPFTIKPGPNNPVGVVWINLSLKGYGIHGTPEPSQVSKTASHGCIRLTNWDAKDVAAMVEKGTPVAFLAGGKDDALASRAEDTTDRRSRRGRRR